ncbi:MAG TPA: protein kinase, partial [Mycobacteriales bacterium]|nr:protein kinase [Mycobacteriales bacterium]
MGSRVAVVAGSLIAGRYRLTEPLAGGDTGTVWRAEDDLVHRSVAVKEIRLPPDLDTETAEQLRQIVTHEAWAVARLRHPTIVGVHDVVQQEGRPWIVMQYVPSQSLDYLMRTQGPLSPENAARVGLRIVEALEAADESGFHHGSLKPTNVLIGEDGQVVMTDFGITRHVGDQTLALAGLVTATPGFLAPEQVLGEPATVESDLWSLGAVLYAAVEGGPPFERNESLSTVWAIVRDDPPRARHAGPLQPVIDGLLVKDPARRLTPDETARMLKKVVRGGPVRSPVRQARPAASTSAFPLVGPPVAAPPPAGRSSDAAAETPAAGVAREAPAVAEGPPPADDAAAVAEAPTATDDAASETGPVAESTPTGARDEGLASDTSRSATASAPVDETRPETGAGDVRSDRENGPADGAVTASVAPAAAGAAPAGDPPEAHGGLEADGVSEVGGASAGKEPVLSEVPELAREAAPDGGSAPPAVASATDAAPLNPEPEIHDEEVAAAFAAFEAALPDLSTDTPAYASATAPPEATASPEGAAPPQRPPVAAEPAAEHGAEQGAPRSADAAAAGNGGPADQAPAGQPPSRDTAEEPAAQEQAAEMPAPTATAPPGDDVPANGTPAEGPGREPGGQISAEQQRGVPQPADAAQASKDGPADQAPVGAPPGPEPAGEPAIETQAAGGPPPESHVGSVDEAPVPQPDVEGPEPAPTVRDAATGEPDLVPVGAPTAPA